MLNKRFADVAIVGGGIVGLAFAYAYAKRGRKVTVFERNEYAVGASVRNFGLIWPIGQCGRAYDRAMRSREIWLQIIQQTGLWLAPAGSIHLAYAEDEAAVLNEYLRASDPDAGRELLSANEVLAKSRAVEPTGLLNGLWSPTEIQVDPRQTIRILPKMLREAFGVECVFGASVTDISLPHVNTTMGEWSVEEAVVCSGADFESLYPEFCLSSGMTRCKLQMMRTRPQSTGWHLGPSICAGLTLAHYDNFKECPSLPGLKARFARELPFHVENGIHVLLSETARGELTIGDSHHYGLTLEPFDYQEINDAILGYLQTFARFPVFEIAERWNGAYPKLPGQTEFVAQPEPGVRIVTGLGGAGMTVSFGLAEEIVSGSYSIVNPSVIVNRPGPRSPWEGIRL